jgi:hypothetical protein
MTEVEFTTSSKRDAYGIISQVLAYARQVIDRVKYLNRETGRLVADPCLDVKALSKYVQSNS